MKLKESIVILTPLAAALQAVTSRMVGYMQWPCGTYPAHGMQGERPVRACASPVVEAGTFPETEKTTQITLASEGMPDIICGDHHCGKS